MIAASCTTPNSLPPWFDTIDQFPLHSVTVHNQTVAYLDIGQGPPVILIHGFSGSMWQWERQILPLSQTYRVIIPDLIGHGLSDKPDIDYTADELVQSFIGFLDALHLDHAILVGNSMGGGVAIGTALTIPSRIDHLVLIAPMPPAVRERLASPLLRRGINTPSPEWLASAGNWLFGRGLTEVVLKELVYDHTRLTPLVIERAYLNRSRPGAIPPLLRLIKSLPTWENGFATQISRISHPTLLLWGMEDRVFLPKVGSDLQQLIPGAQLKLIPNAGHIPQWEQPDVVNVQIRSFLQP